MEARSRLGRHESQLQLRAAADAQTGAGVVPPQWLADQFAAVAHGRRPLADTVANVATANANAVLVGRQTAGAVIDIQAGENTPPADGDLVADMLTVVPSTLAGKVDVSRQLLDGSSPGVDGLVYTDSEAAYGARVERMLVATLTAAPKVTTVAPPAAPDTIVDSIVEASLAVRKNRFTAPTVIACSDDDWAFLATAKDEAGRPLITTGAWTVSAGAVGLGLATTYGHVDGEAVGIPIVSSWAMPVGRMFVFVASDVLLLEAPLQHFRIEQTIGPQTIRLAAWGYAGVVADRYDSIAEVQTGVAGG